MAEPADVPPEILSRLRAICAALPESEEEAAWVGTRWRVRTKTFAHVLFVDAGWPPAYARAAGHSGPRCVVMFRSRGPELDALRRAGPPFFAPPWRPDEVGVVLDERSDWQELAELVTESYRALAPRKLAEQVTEPPDPGPAGG